MLRTLGRRRRRGNEDDDDGDDILGGLEHRCEEWMKLAELVGASLHYLSETNKALARVMHELLDKWASVNNDVSPVIKKRLLAVVLQGMHMTKRQNTVLMKIKEEKRRSSTNPTVSNEHFLFRVNSLNDLTNFRQILHWLDMVVKEIGRESFVQVGIRAEIGVQSSKFEQELKALLRDMREMTERLPEDIKFDELVVKLRTAIDTFIASSNEDGPILRRARKVMSSSKKLAMVAITRLEQRSCAIGPEELQVLDQFGMGTFGDVHDATFDGQTVAAKRLRNSWTVPEHVWRRHELLDNLEVFRGLAHPNIVHLFGSCNQMYRGQQCLFLVMEKCEIDLGQAIFGEEGQVLETEAVVDYVKQLLNGLQFLHENNILHCDIKPSNVLLAQGRTTVKLADYALRMEWDHTSYRGSKPRGLANYLAPEVLQEPRLWTEKADIYALGLVLFSMVTNQRPFSRLTSREHLKSVIAGKEADVSALDWADSQREDMSDERIQLCMDITNSCCNPDIQERPSASKLRHFFVE